jgi:hypothetical protein
VIDAWAEFERNLFEKVIRDIAEAYHELPNNPPSQARQEFHAMMGHALIDSAVGGDEEGAVMLVRSLYGAEAILKKVLPTG